MDMALMLTGFVMQAADSDGSSDWPEAIIAASAAVAGITMITVIVSIALWQGLGAWKTRMQVSREQAYQKLAEELSVTQHTMMTELQKMSSDLSDLRARTAELERMLKEV